MKKLLALALAVMMISSMAVVASAANTTTLTTSVPAAAYTLNIPADQKIEFGATRTNIGSVSVTNASGFAVDKNLEVTIAYTPFTCSSTDTTIPFSMTLESVSSTQQDDEISINTGDSILFKGLSDGSVEEYCKSQYLGGATMISTLDRTYISISSEAWGKALAGEYTATITFTAEVVVEQ